MALFMKQDFSPPILSRRWIAVKFRPNMLIHSRENIISILESGLLFREDSIEVEQGAPSPEEVWRAAGGGMGGWMTKGERLAVVVTFAACVSAFPPTSMSRGAACRVCACAGAAWGARAALRARGAGRGLRALLAAQRDYLALARRAAACLRESAALHQSIGSLSSVIECTRAALARQQRELAVLMARASSALLGNVPWLRADVAWDALEGEPTDNLMKIHHAFLVVQSTLLKHIAMAHFVPTTPAKMYKNHNERIHWIHTVLIQLLLEEFQSNYEALERMYRLLKNYGTRDQETRKPCTALSNCWLYSDVHSGVARASLELKIALNKCTSIDMFLDSCAVNKQDIDLNILDKDIDDLIEDVTKCLKTMQNSQIRLNKLRNKFTGNTKIESVDEKSDKEEIDEAEILIIEDKEPETKDEVFYFIKTEDDVVVQPVSDVTTGPGKKELETSKVVISELRRKLVKREDAMRERERQALVKTMPELKDNVPEFPRQNNMEEVLERKGYIFKLRNKVRKTLFRCYLIQSKKKNINTKRYKLKIQKYDNENHINDTVYKTNAKIHPKCGLISVIVANEQLILIKWCKILKKTTDFDSSGMSDGLSDVEVNAANKTVNETVNTNRTHQLNSEAVNLKFSKKELELSPSSSESDFEFYKQKQVALLNDIRKHRVARKKKFPVKRPSLDREDESLRPVQYSFGTGMAIASVLQVNSQAKHPNMAQEEVFIGDGEVSSDSGNDEDAIY